MVIDRTAEELEGRQFIHTAMSRDGAGPETIEAMMARMSHVLLAKLGLTPGDAVDFANSMRGNTVEVGSGAIGWRSVDKETEHAQIGGRGADLGRQQEQQREQQAKLDEQRRDDMKRDDERRQDEARRLEEQRQAEKLAAEKKAAELTPEQRAANDAETARIGMMPITFGLGLMGLNLGGNAIQAVGNLLSPGSLAGTQLVASNGVGGPLAMLRDVLGLGQGKDILVTGPNQTAQFTPGEPLPQGPLAGVTPPARPPVAPGAAPGLNGPTMGTA